MADIVWKTTKLPDCIVGVPYEASLAVISNATAFSAGTATGLPSSGHLVVNADHVRITGMATAVDVGTYTVVVTLTDTAGAVASGNLALVVRYADEGDTAALVATGSKLLADEARKWPK